MIRQPVVGRTNLKHRGRHQAQGNDINGGNESKNWALVDPYPADTGHADLTGLEQGLGKAARERRVMCFRQAHRFIDRAKQAGGVGPTSGNFPAARPGEDTDIRVDIEVRAGIAFV